MKKILLSLLCLGATLCANAQAPLPVVAAKSGKSTVKFRHPNGEARPVKTNHKANYLLTDVVPDGETMAYGFSKFDRERWSNTYSFYKFSTANPYNQAMTKVADYFPHMDVNWLPEVTAQSFVGNELWASMIRPFSLGYFYVCGFYNMDLNDGAYSERMRLYSDDAPAIPTDLSGGKYDSSAPYMLDTSYDPTTGLLWYVAPDLGGNIQFDGWTRPLGWTFGCYDVKNHNKRPVKLGNVPVTVDANGHPTSIEQFANIVADHGKLYSVQNIMFDTGEKDGDQAVWDVRQRYVRIIPNVEAETYELEVIKDYDADELWMQPTDYIGVVIGSSLELDRDNRRLYLSYSSATDYNCYLSELDINTGDILKTSLQGGEAFAAGALAIPYQDCKDDAPANVTGLTVVAGAAGTNNATITWTNPTGCYYDRSKDPQLQGLHIYRDDQLVGTCDADATTYIDTNVPYASYKYTVVPFNAAGEGLKEARTVFVGRDLPGAPLNVSLTATGSEATITWDAPATGSNGTWFDPSTLTYDVTRLPDNVTVATGLTVTTCTDVVSTARGYSYVVTACNAEGVGLSATSNILTFGPALALPYIADFDDINEFNTWMVIDHNNDGFKWQFFPYSYGGSTKNCAAYDATFCHNKPSDYLMSPTFATVEGEEYKLEYEVMVHNYEYTSEKFGWYHGASDAYPGNGGLNRFEEGEYNSFDGLKWFTRQGVFTAESNEERVAFSVLSEPYMGILYLRKVTLRPYSNCDLRAAAINGSTIGTKGRSIPYTVSVKNEGKKTVRNFKIRVYDEAKTSVAEQEFNEAILSEETTDFIVRWTPKKTGSYKIYAEVIVDGDTFTDDNATPTPVYLEVDESAEGDWRTVGSADFYGPCWCAINFPYSISQALYLKSELLLDKGDLITGIGFIYQGSSAFEGFDEVEFEVNLGNTNLEKIYDWDRLVHEGSYYPHLLRSRYFPTNIFYGFADASATEGLGKLIFPCEEPFVYDGSNLLIQVIRTASSKIASEPLCFQFQRMGDSWDENNIGDPNGRSLNQYGDVPVAEAAQGRVPAFGDNCLPVLVVGYISPSGIKGVKTLGGKLTVNSQRGELQFNDVCRDVVVTDLQGRVVARADKAQSVSVPTNLSGACIVTATLSDGTTISQKAILK